MRIQTAQEFLWVETRLLVEEKTKCKGIKASIHDPSVAKFCLYCNHYALTDNENNCNCCGSHVPNKRKYGELKIFEKIIRLNHGAIMAWMGMPSEPDFNFGWPIRIGMMNYFVPVRYFAEFLELPDLEGKDLQKKFLENVKRECMILPRYMHVIK